MGGWTREVRGGEGVDRKGRGRKEKKGVSRMRRRDRQIKRERERESDDNYPLDFCPAPVVNQPAPLGKEPAYHWLH